MTNTASFTPTGNLSRFLPPAFQFTVRQSFSSVSLRPLSLVSGALEAHLWKHECVDLSTPWNGVASGLKGAALPGLYLRKPMLILTMMLTEYREDARSPTVPLSISFSPSPTCVVSFYWRPKAWLRDLGTPALLGSVRAGWGTSAHRPCPSFPHRSTHRPSGWRWEVHSTSAYFVFKRERGYFLKSFRESLMFPLG